MSDPTTNALLARIKDLEEQNFWWKAVFYVMTFNFVIMIICEVIK